MPGHDVDDPALAPHVERNFRRTCPSADPLQELERDAMEHCVAIVEQPAQLAAAPARRDAEVDLEDNGHPSQDAERYVLQAPALDPGHDRRGRPRHRRDVHLPQPSSPPHGTNHEAHLHVRHASSLRPRAYQPLSRRAA